MKKRIAVLCALLVAFSALNCHATEIYGDGSATATVVYHQSGEYTIMIPETISADGTHYKITAATMELAGSESVNVTVTGMDDNKNIILSTTDGVKNATAKMYRTDNDYAVGSYDIIGTFFDGQLEAQDEFWVLMDGDVSPGDYYGTLTFNVSLNSY